MYWFSSDRKCDTQTIPDKYLYIWFFSSSCGLLKWHHAYPCNCVLNWSNFPLSADYQHNVLILVIGCVMVNKWWGITEGHRVTTCWFHNRIKAQPKHVLKRNISATWYCCLGRTTNHLLEMVLFDYRLIFRKSFNIHCYVFTLEQAMKTQKGSSGIASPLDILFSDNLI